MIIKEYRVVMPMTVEEYQVAQLFSVAEVSKENTGGGEGIEVVKNEPFDNKSFLDGQYTSGQYTYKIFHLHSKVPGWIRMLAPKGSLEVHEEAWNAYPYCRTVITNPDYMKDGFHITIETLHVGDNGTTHNAHNLAPEHLSKREVVEIDIANDPVSRSDYKADEDPKIFKSQKTGRGPLDDPNWKNMVDPVMCCYKLVTVEFKWFGLQNRVESFIQKSERNLFTVFNRKVWCWADKWFGLTIADIRAMEERVRQELDEQRHHGEVRGMVESDK